MKAKIQKMSTRPKPKRIFIIGGAGSGKSTLARELAKVAQLPLHHMDRLFWKPGWTTSDKIKAKFDTRISQIVGQRSWVLEGAYKRSLPTVLKRAEMVVYMDTHPWICAKRVAKRWIDHYIFNRPRPDLPVGCQEQIDLGFIREALDWQRKQKPQILQAIRVYGDSKKVLYLRSKRTVADFLTRMKYSV